MANGKITLGKQSGGQLALVIPDGVASSTVQLTFANVSATFIRAIVSTVGATVVAGYVSIKAWS